MRFKCGLTQAEEDAARRERRRIRESWKRRFAWLPTTISKGQCVWWEFYEEREVWVPAEYWPVSHWRVEYRLVNERTDPGIT